MIIDFHTHIFPDKIAHSTISALSDRSGNKPCTDGTVSGLQDAMSISGTDICVALPVLTKPTQFETVTNFALSVNKRFENESKRIISFAGIHPACDDIDGKMKYLKSVGFKGVKIHPDYQNTFINDKGYIEILNSAKKYDLIVVTHSGVDEGFSAEPVKCPPEMVLELINEISYGKFVLAHYGGNKLWKEVFNKLAGKNVYFDTAFTLHEIEENTFKDILYKHGPDKILFATDCPWQDIKLGISLLKSYKLGNEIENKIFYQNALKLLNI